MVEGIIIIDSQGIIQAVNKAVFDLFSYSAEELIGENVKILMPKSYADQHDSYIDNHNRTGEIKILDVGREVHGQRKDGSVFSLNLKVNKINYQDHDFYIGIIHDIQEKIDSNDQLTYQAELLERAEKVAHLGHWYVDIENNHVFWSKEIYRIHGVTPDTYTPEIETAINFYYPEDQKKVDLYLRKAIDEKKDFTFEARIIRPSGEVRYVRSSGEFTEGKKGKTSQIFGVFQDITEIKETQKKLTAVEHDKKAYADATNDGYWDWFLLDDYEYMSSRFWEMLGYDSSEKTHHPSEWQKLIFEDDLAIALENFDKHVQSKGEYPFYQEVRYRHKDGSTVYVICKGKVVEWNESGEPVRMIGTHTDITKLKETESELVNANHELEEFAYRTSHDLRSPLVSSISLLDFARESLEKNDVENVKESIQHTKSLLIKLESLVKDILSLTKIRKLEEDKEEISVEGLVRESLEKFSNMENFDRLDMQTHFNHKTTIKASRSRIQLIVENLISNSIKYQDLNEETPFVKIETYCDQHNFIFSVKDNGLGVPKKYQEELFQMFKRFHARVSFGSGLGLYMIKKSADKLKGHIIFEDQDKGALFKLVIPFSHLK